MPKSLKSLGWIVMILLQTAPWIPAQSGQASKPDRRDRQEEALDYYQKWLKEDVLYLISAEEEAIFLGLTNNAERDNFIEQFWLRRDPDPRTKANEFKDEHYRRIQYANERFPAGIPGWRTDRGRIYIRYGPPDRQERYPLGGRYDRKDYEGGGVTSVFPFERWEYRHLPGLGSDIELEFVDSKGSNLYELTMDAQEKDEFLRVPNMGLTFTEMFGPAFEGRKSWERVVGLRPGGDANRQGILFDRAKDDPFQKAELMARLSKAPEIRHTDLREVVTTSVHFDQLPFQARIDWFRIDPDSWLVPLTLSFETGAVSFEESAEGWRSHLQVYGQASTLGGRVAAEFEEDIISTSSTIPDSLTGYSVFQHKWLLPPGRYKVELVVKDTISEKVGTKTLGFLIPVARIDDLAASPLVLAHRIEPSTADLSQPLIQGPFKIVPAVDRPFSSSGSLGFYFEIYNFTLDQASGRPELQIEYALVGPQSQQETFRDISDGATFESYRVYVGRVVQLNHPPGRYELVCRIRDQLTAQTIRTRVPLEIIAPVQ
jgi:GWxTD domain-containing protein